MYHLSSDIGMRTGSREQRAAERYDNVDCLPCCLASGFLGLDVLFLDYSGKPRGGGGVNGSEVKATLDFILGRAKVRFLHGRTQVPWNGVRMQETAGCLY